MISRQALQKSIVAGFGDNIKTPAAKKRAALLKTVNRRKSSRQVAVKQTAKTL